MITSFGSALNRLGNIALEEPPAPNTTIFEPLTFKSLEIRSSINPAPSVLSAHSTPPSFQSVLADWAAEQVSVCFFATENAFSFKGNVTFKPI